MEYTQVICVQPLAKIYTRESTKFIISIMLLSWFVHRPRCELNGSRKTILNKSLRKCTRESNPSVRHHILLQSYQLTKVNCFLTNAYIFATYSFSLCSHFCPLDFAIPQENEVKVQTLTATNNDRYLRHHTQLFNTLNTTISALHHFRTPYKALQLTHPTIIAPPINCQRPGTISFQPCNFSGLDPYLARLTELISKGLRSREVKHYRGCSSNSAAVRFKISGRSGCYS